MKIKKIINICLFSLFILGTIGFLVPTLIWAVNENTANESKILNASVVINENTCLEYLTDMPLKKDVSLNIGTDKKPNIIESDQLTFEADFSSAGYKEVLVSYQKDEKHIYEGKYDVYVCLVRRLRVDSLDSIELNSDKTSFYAGKGAVLKAEVYPAPKSPIYNVSTNSNGLPEVILTNDMYTTKVSSSNKGNGYYVGTIFCGAHSYSFDFFAIENVGYLLNGTTSFVFFTNTSGGNESLFLNVTNKTSATYLSDSSGSSEGTYYFSKDSNVTEYPFSFALNPNNEQFNSKNIKETHDFNTKIYRVEIDGIIFEANEGEWQKCVVNNIYTKCGNMFFVTNSSERIVEFESVKGCNLYLFATEYRMDSEGNGDTWGYYCFINEKSETFRMKFHLWTDKWTSHCGSNEYRDESTYFISDTVDYNDGSSLVVTVKHKDQNDIVFKVKDNIWPHAVYNI